ncbi:hypothetical protein OG589_11150 [Sphaerisporangium sp. NBC_01403]|uniref:hypothetical protein n=1 Tax=Sphaerisporangium sp. NBC_01403 TaxID=2903599 RepID=UPI0032508CA5
MFELGARTHGPHGSDLATSLIDQIHRWDKEHRDTAPRIDAHLKPCDKARIAAMTVIERVHTVLAVTW